MGVEVKSGGEGVIVADRGCNERCCCDLKNGQQEIKSYRQVSYREHC